MKISCTCLGSIEYNQYIVLYTRLPNPLSPLASSTLDDTSAGRHMVVETAIHRRDDYTTKHIRIMLETEM
jgi:hypothetical protein